MTPQQLLQDRYEVISHYPGSDFKIGETISLWVTDAYTGKEQFYKGDKSGALVRKTNIDQCPAIFRKLHWSEHRQLKEMPKYIGYKSLTLEEINEADPDVILKVRKWIKRKNRFSFYIDRLERFTPFALKHTSIELAAYYFPSDKEAYDAYQKRKNKKAGKRTEA